MYYADHPELRIKKFFNEKTWSLKMVESLVNMMLAMWANRCKCVHGHTKEEQQLRRKELLMQKLQGCFRLQRQIPTAYHQIFRRSPIEMWEECSAHYMEEWIVTFEAIRMQTQRKYCDWFHIRKGKAEVDEEADEESSVNTMDREEYLVDINDGMDIEYMMADAGKAAIGSGRGNTNGNDEVTTSGEYGDMELRKRKPPDGGGTVHEARGK